MNQGESGRGASARDQRDRVLAADDRFRRAIMHRAIRPCYVHFVVCEQYL